MPNSATGRTKWAPKHARLAALCAAVLVLVWVVALVPSTVVRLRLGNRWYFLEQAVTPTQRMRGLGGRPSMAADHGMLFQFPGVAPRCFWMKDMHFPLDIIWLDQQRRVVHVESSISPRSYPANFCPTQPAQYVIELSAGQAQAGDLHLGQQLTF